MARTTATQNAAPHRQVFRRALALACGLAGLAATGQVGALELLTVMAQRDGEAYLLQIEAVFEVPPDRLLEVLTDYDRLHELHPWMVESRDLGPVGPGTREVYTRTEGCVLLYCRTLHRVEWIREEPSRLVAEAVAGRGSFREGSTEWRFTPERSGTRLVYQARFVPAFWVPPLLGPGALARSVERMTVEMLGAAERRAAQADD